ncbi:Zinc finger and BTB domain-containing protein 24 [Plakobranchus ocellatus]|uniref:Zinc finger and BTB domain-containing protein 24 n=1 Tax=Plakobranchus ocellatus TaxID=259542 RepID=A0AAV4AHV6_9GAST|nr:Zinc finger and BTB domain-containing protein 24 [Plakobranchus ocellatus]
MANIHSGYFRDPDFVKRTLLALNDQRNFSHFCDVILKVCDTQIFAHSNVLAAASPYFRSFLGTGADFPRAFSQKVPQIIEIHIDTTDGDNGYGEAVTKIIDYMYTSQITLTSTVISQIMEISKIMQMETLLGYCGEFQKGVESNFPMSKQTCTTGLEDIVYLMGGRAKTIKRIDASTETEETIFRKVEKGPMLSPLSNVSHVSPSEDIGPLGEIQKCDTSVNKAVKSKQMDGQREPGDLNTINYNTGQSEASLLLEISKVRPPDPSSQSIEKISQGNELGKKIQNDSNCTFSETTTARSTDEYLKNVHALEDMMDIAEERSEVSGFSEHDHSQLISDTQVKEKDNKGLEDFKETGDINLEEISDLVKFGLFTPSITVASNSQIKDHSRGRLRGRGGGRSRGRGRGRRGRPGRPRKPIKEDQESDPEFDELMEKLEKGDDVTAAIGRSDENSSAISDVPGENMSNNTITSDKLWTSSRKRSKPSQLSKDYVMHSLAKRSNKRTDSGKLSSVSALQKSCAKTTSGLKFVCQKCEFSSSVFREYRQHMKAHPETDPRNFICDKAGCNFKTTRSREFTAHKHKHMSEELVCTICEHRSDTQEDFDSHKKRHEGQNPYFCTECDSRFRTRAQLLAHKPKHQLEKPFVCAICHAGFKWKHALKNHMVTHSATKDHLCDECGYATAHKSQLKAHMLVHTGLMFRCPHPDCTFQATKRQNLKYHMVTHTQEKPHQCEVCGQSFSLIKNMRRHMLLHTGTRPYSCPLCGFSTTRYDKLKEHNQKLHTKIEVPVSASEEPAPQMVAAEAILPKTDVHQKITYVSSSGDSEFVVSKTVEDGSITQETLQTIMQLTNNQDIQETTIIQQQGSDGNIYPIITTVKLYEDEDGVKYIAT